MSSITAQHKAIASHIASALGVERPAISQFWDDNKQSNVYILKADNRPQDGVSTFATVGLSSHPLIYEGKGFDAGVELIAACGTAFPHLDNILATLAFCVINSKWFCAPGIIFPDVVSMYGVSVTMSDVYFAHPFLWEEKLRSTQIGGRNMAWLLAVPVSKAEAEYARVNGPEKLESLFEENNIDIFNMNRASVV